MSEENGYTDASDRIGRPDKTDDSLATLAATSKGWKELIEIHMRKDDPLPGRPAPIVPADVDLRNMPYMPLDVARLRDSGMANHPNPEVFRSAVLLWCASWHQVPAASLPNDDIELARFAGFGRDHQGWLAIREEALRGFVECSDGRFYHRVVAEKALAAWDKKWDRPDRAEERSDHARVAAKALWKKKKKKHARLMPEQCPPDAQPMPDPCLKESKGKGIEENKKEKISDRSVADATRSDPLGDLFEELWKAYPSRGQASNPKKPAKEKFLRLVKDGEDPQAMIAGARKYSEIERRRGTLGTDKVAQMQTWLNQHRWKDYQGLPARNLMDGII